MERTETILGQAMVVRWVDNHQISISGRLPRIARLRSEPYECLSTPEDFIGTLKDDGLPADIFTFIQELGDSVAVHGYHRELESYAVVPVTTYDHWWKKQIDAKTRNMIRKAEKSGVELRVAEFDDSLVAGIVEIYNETPVRQGKRFWHFGKDFETIKRDHETFLERSRFIGAFHGNELIGFAKLVRGRNVESLMQIISKVAHRDKAPTNALIAKAVQMCSDAKVPYLHYGVWSRGGLGLFKKSHAFVRHDVPRYFVPLNARGRLALKVNLHRRWTEIVPEKWIERLAPLRQRWNSSRYGAK